MVEKYFGGTLIPERESDPMDEELISLIRPCALYAAQMDEFQLHLALEEVFKLIQRANKYIDETAPWVLARDEMKKPRLASVMYNLLEALRAALTMLTPFMPESCGQGLRPDRRGERTYHLGSRRGIRRAARDGERPQG